MQQFLKTRLSHKKGFRHPGEMREFLKKCKEEYKQLEVKKETRIEYLDSSNFSFPVSYDLFDTLIYRICKEPFHVFDRMGQLLNDPSFREKRMTAEKRASQRVGVPNLKFHDIYVDYVQKYGGDLEQLKQLEFGLECEFCYPNMNLCKNLKNGDIIVSDMYFSEEELRELLCWVEKKNNACFPLSKLPIYVSYAGKAHGYIWKTIGQDVRLHLGDNPHSDVVQPPRFRSIETKHYLFASDFTPLEEMMNTKNRGVALMMRHVRLSNPYPENCELYQVFHEQSQINIPLNLLVSLFLGKVSGNTGFIMRDGFFCKTYYDILFPEKQAVAVQGTRQAFLQESMIDYFRDVFGKVDLLFDMQSSGRTLDEFFQKHPALKTPLYCFQSNNPNTPNDIITKVFIQPVVGLKKTIGWYSECMNVAPFGSFVVNTPIGNKRHENDTKEHYVNCMVLANMKAWEAMQHIHIENKEFSEEDFRILWNSCEEQVCLNSGYQSKHETPEYIQPAHFHVCIREGNRIQNLVLKNFYENLVGNICFIDSNADLRTAFLDLLASLPENHVLVFQKDSNWFQKESVLVGLTHKKIGFLSRSMRTQNVYTDSNLILIKKTFSYKDSIQEALA